MENGMSITLGNRTIGLGQPVYIVAELSANHNGKFEQAVQLLHTAKHVGADAIKLQTYTADTLTIRSDRPCFRIGGGTLWDGRTLHDLYSEAYTPWEWQPKLKAIANEIGLDCFSSPFDPTAVDFLESMGVPAYKIASPEIIDIPLIEKIARTRKPIILSTGMATLDEIEEAVSAARKAGAQQIILLKCTSAYPAPPEEMNLRTIPAMAERFQVAVGLSDHTLGTIVPIAAVSLGACMIEKHLTLSRSVPGPDSSFSLEPDEFANMVKGARVAEKALGKVFFGVSPREEATHIFRRSLFVAHAVRKGTEFNRDNVRSIRPAHGLHPRYLPEVLGRCAARDIEAGTPLAWELIEHTETSAAMRGSS
jgi:pseudaminic acid synthase